MYSRKWNGGPARRRSLRGTTVVQEVIAIIGHGIRGRVQWQKHVGAKQTVVEMSGWTVEGSYLVLLNCSCCRCRPPSSMLFT